MNQFYVKFLLLVTLITISLPIKVSAVLEIDVSQSGSSAMPIALPFFVPKTAAEMTMGRQMAEVIENDLESTSFFRSVDRQAFLQRFNWGSTTPNFTAWRQIDAQILLVGKIEFKAGNTLFIEWALWDIFNNKYIVANRYTSTQDNWRRMAHKIADEIYTKLTAEGKMFDSRIVYIAESGPKTNRVKRLAIMDQDGGNHKYLSNGGDLVLTPRFSTAEHQIIYLAYGEGSPRVRVRDIQTGREEVLGNFAGMTFSPRFSPDGGSVIMSVANSGNTDIFEVNLRNRARRQITNHPAIDTSPYYSPDGNYIVFNSDRSGKQQLYVMDRYGNNPNRISMGSGRYSTPVWSPDGKHIAFTKSNNGQFMIGVMQPNGGGERILTSGFLVEGPSWSPNGRFIIYTKQGRGGRSELWKVSLDGKFDKKLNTPAEASDATWSGLLKN